MRFNGQRHTHQRLLPHLEQTTALSTERPKTKKKNPTRSHLCYELTGEEKPCLPFHVSQTDEQMRLDAERATHTG